MVPRGIIAAQGRGSAPAGSFGGQPFALRKAGALKGLPQKISREAAFAALVIAAIPIVEAAKAYCPVETGSLRQSLGSVIRKYQRGMLFIQLVGARRGFGVKGREPANYAHLVENGHNISRQTARSQAETPPRGGPLPWRSSGARVQFSTMPATG